MEQTYQEAWNEKLNELKAMHGYIAELCTDKSVGYIDIPLHFNVGDQLIYAGTEAFFKENNINVVYRAFDVNVNFKALEKCEIIVFHGGGNFGDIYPAHQRLRERVITAFPNKRIIGLPQTLHFSSEVELQKSKDIFSSHSDFHMFVRDKKSFDIAQGFTPNCKLMPDMAHSLHPLIDITEVESTEVRSPRILNLRRVDVEKVTFQVPINKPSFDWCNLLTPWDKIHYKWILKLQPYKRLSDRLINSWKVHSDSLVFRSINHFNSFNVVYTDRLHGFILSFLLGKNIKLMDNSYGKNMGYFNQWIKENKLIDVLVEAKEE
ncbi:polysaccharide pyruvyl transferase family protein [Agaribacter flavus]|uniref:Polysaccharide pyruvyl transferase family protein n=1 Tax=Agaribacter flavus TaxID=1902781 RepID=A0ABV7FND2_9ALTE